MSRESLDLGGAMREFLRHRSPRTLLVAFAAALVAKLWIGGWTLVDLVVPLVMIALQPFVEWVIHVFLLHWRPRRVAGILIDPLASREHRRHHVDPWELPLVFIPYRTLLMSLAAVLIGWTLLAPTPAIAATGLLTQATIGLFYEWTHFVCHISYRPRTAFMRERVRHHRLHHFKNERYWMGVTLHLGDRVLGTAPGADAVPMSPTARNLHGEA